MDMTRAYQTQANSGIRGFALAANRPRFVIQDEIDSKQASELWWSMHTRAAIEVSADGKSAILSQSGKRMRATIISPKGASFQTMKAEPLPGVYQNEYQSKNEGIQKSVIKPTDVKATAIRIEIIPIRTDADLKTRSLPFHALRPPR